LVDAHGGTIEVARGASGRGVVVRLVLPSPPAAGN
jgi:hypothetical protein